MLLCRWYNNRSVQAQTQEQTQEQTPTCYRLIRAPSCCCASNSIVYLLSTTITKVYIYIYIYMYILNNNNNVPVNMVSSEIKIEWVQLWHSTLADMRVNACRFQHFVDRTTQNYHFYIRIIVTKMALWRMLIIISAENEEYFLARGCFIGLIIVYINTWNFTRTHVLQIQTPHFNIYIYIYIYISF